MASLCSVLLDQKRSDFKEAYRRIFNGMLFAWFMVKQVVKLDQYERLTSHWLVAISTWLILSKLCSLCQSKFKKDYCEWKMRLQN